MVNEDIVTALKNAINSGDSLESAMQIMISSGYDSNEVQEASQFIGGVSTNLQTRPDEHLIMPEQKKGLFGRKKVNQQVPSQYQQPQQYSQQQPIQNQQQYQPQSHIPQPQQQNQYQNIPQQQSQQPQIRQLQQDINSNLQQYQPVRVQPLTPERQSQMYSKQTQQPAKKPKKPHKKEIILVAVLIILVLILISTIVFKDTILGWFS
ncbi:MAG: hypothetical protein ABIH37_04715 [archaeon]